MDRWIVRDNRISHTASWDRYVTTIMIAVICVSIISFLVVRSQEVETARDRETTLKDEPVPAEV